jgi:hypothetical protein
MPVFQKGMDFKRGESGFHSKTVFHGSGGDKSEPTLKAGLGHKPF